MRTPKCMDNKGMKEHQRNIPHVNWDILKPIMKICNDQFDPICKSPKGPSKVLRSKIL